MIRRDANLAVMASSGEIAATAWVDDVSAVASGTRINYVARAIAQSGLAGPFGGDLAGMPVYITVP